MKFEAHYYTADFLRDQLSYDVDVMLQLLTQEREIFGTAEEAWARIAELHDEELGCFDVPQTASGLKRRTQLAGTDIWEWEPYGRPFAWGIVKVRT